MTVRLTDLEKTTLGEVLSRPRRKLVLTHPGQLLRAEFLKPHRLSANALANALHVPANRITAILNGQRAITADTGLRLGRFFGTTAWTKRWLPWHRWRPEGAGARRQTTLHAAPVLPADLEQRVRDLTE